MTCCQTTLLRTLHAAIDVKTSITTYIELCKKCVITEMTSSRGCCGRCRNSDCYWIVLQGFIVLWSLDKIKPANMQKINEVFAYAFACKWWRYSLYVYNHIVAEKALFVVSPPLHSVRHIVACLSISHNRECYSFLAVWEGVIHDLGYFCASLVLVVALRSPKADYIWVARSRSLDGDRWLDDGYPVISAKLDLVNLKRFASPLVRGLGIFTGFLPPPGVSPKRQSPTFIWT